MFADLVGSTALSAQLDPEDLRDLLATYHRMVSEVVKAHGGHVAQYLGDGALIYFGYPMSHEDDGERALETGLSLLKHALVQDAAYSTLLRGQKQSLHRSIAKICQSAAAQRRWRN
jgi:class 3 adenylate cyclase